MSQSQSPWEREKKKSSFDLFQAGNQDQGEGKMAKECETPVPDTLHCPHRYSYSILVLEGVGEK